MRSWSQPGLRRREARATAQDNRNTPLTSHQNLSVTTQSRTTCSFVSSDVPKLGHADVRETRPRWTRFMVGKILPKVARAGLGSHCRPRVIWRSLSSVRWNDVRILRADKTHGKHNAHIQARREGWLKGTGKGGVPLHCGQCKNDQQGVTRWALKGKCETLRKHTSSPSTRNKAVLKVGTPSKGAAAPKTFLDWIRAGGTRRSSFPSQDNRKQNDRIRKRNRGGGVVVLAIY